MISYLKFHWIALGRLDKLWTKKNYDELISFCDTILSKNPTDYLAWYYRGLANEKLNLLDESITDLKKSEETLNAYKSKELGKEYLTRIPIQLSRVYRKLQDNQKSIEYLTKL